MSIESPVGKTYEAAKLSRVSNELNAFFIEGDPLHETILAGILAREYSSVSINPEAIHVSGLDNIAGSLKPDMHFFTASDEYVEAARLGSHAIVEVVDETGRLSYSALQHKTAGLKEVTAQIHTRDIIMDARRLFPAERSLLDAFADSDRVIPDWFLRMRPATLLEADDLRMQVLRSADLTELTKRLHTPPQSSGLSKAALRMAGIVAPVTDEAEEPIIPSEEYFGRMGTIHCSGTLGMLVEEQSQEEGAIALLGHMAGRLRSIVGESIVRAATDLGEGLCVASNKVEDVARKTVSDALSMIALHAPADAPAHAWLMRDEVLNVLSLAFTSEKRQSIGHNLTTEDGFATVAYGNKFLLSLVPSSTGATWMRINTIRAEHDEATVAQAFRTMNKHMKRQAA